MARKKTELRKESSELFELFDDKFGKGMLRPFGEKEIDPIVRIASSSLKLNDSLGGGIPLGRFVEVFGVQSSGKTTLCLDFIKNAQELGEVAVVDAEHALDLEWARRCGVNVEKLWLPQPDNGEQAIEMLRAMVATSKFRLIVVDSVAALIPQAELEGDVGEAHMGRQARLMSQSCKMLKGLCDKHDCTIIWINQTRKNLSGYGAADNTTGGEALKFYCDVRMELRIKEAIKSGEQRVGHSLYVTPIKNKSGTPYVKVELTFRYGQGFDFDGEIIDKAVDRGIVEKSGSWYIYGDIKTQGKDAMGERLLAEPDLKQNLLTKLKESA